MLSRRDLLKLGAGAGAGLVLEGGLGLSGRLAAQPASGSTLGGPSGTAPAVSAVRGLQQALNTKPIPKSGEQIPVIGLGSSGTFDISSGNPEYATAQEVVRLFEELGGKVIDSSPTYQRSEQFVGDTIKRLGIVDDVFIATKVNVGSGSQAEAEAQMRQSLAVYGRESIDLMQVWNLGDSIRNLTDRFLEQHMEVVQDWKAQGRIRYLGITTSRDPQYEDLEGAMRQYELDFVQLDYSIDDRIPEQRLLPLARERGIAVLVNRPFTRGGLFARVRGRELPDIAAEIDCTTWAQYFLKFIVSHPAVTCTIPATGDPEHLRDNMGAALGRVPDEAMRQRMIQAFEAG